MQLHKIKNKMIISNDNSMYLNFCKATLAFDLPSLFIYSLLSNFLFVKHLETHSNEEKITFITILLCGIAT